jgi:hypothetical protein
MIFTFSPNKVINIVGIVQKPMFSMQFQSLLVSLTLSDGVFKAMVSDHSE